MSETQKQYVQILNGKWIKDAEAREHIANRGTIFLDNNSTPQDVYQAVMKNRDFGALIVYMHDYKTQGIVATNDCYFIGCSEVTQEQNYAYFFDPGLIAVIKVECSDTNTVQITPEFVALSTLAKVEGIDGRVAALEAASPTSTLDVDSPFSEIENAYYLFMESGTPFVYVDTDGEPCVFVGKDDADDFRPAYIFLNAKTQEFIKIIKGVPTEEGSSPDVVERTSVVKVEYNSETEEMIIGNLNFSISTGE